MDFEGQKGPKVYTPLPPPRSGPKTVGREKRGHFMSLGTNLDPHTEVPIKKGSFWTHEGQSEGPLDLKRTLGASLGYSTLREVGGTMEAILPVHFWPFLDRWSFWSFGLLWTALH